LLKKGGNIRLYAVSVDPPEVSKTFAEKLGSDGKGAIDFQILSDPDHKVIDAYGLRDPAYEKEKVYGIPHPAVYVIDKTGKVAWARIESDYRKRPANSEIRVALEALK
jgi:peroxiredoxin